MRCVNKKLNLKPLVSLIGLALFSSLLTSPYSQAYASTTYTAVPTVPSMTGYFPVEIQNNIGSGAKDHGVKDVYILFTGEQPTGNNPQCLMSLAKTTVTGYNAWIATCNNLTLSTKAADYAQAMSKLQPNSNPVLIYIPQVISGRTFVSLNHPLDIPMTRAANGTVSIQAPSLGNSTDGNYYLIYDKFEYTYDLNNIFWLDVTSVDAFGLPIGISYTTDAASNTTEFGGYISADTPQGQTRGSVIVGVKNYLITNGNSDWLSLVEGAYSNGYNAITRIDAPNTSPSFNPNYLTATTGFNYLNTLINYYSNSANAITVDASEVDHSKYPEYDALNDGGANKDPGAYLFVGTVSNGQWNFTNQATVQYSQDKMTLSINLNQATSGDFFGPGQAPFDTPNGTVRSVIVKYLTAAFSAGLLPLEFPGNLSPTYFATSKSANDYYQMNTILKAAPYYAYGQTKPYSGGPWYDLYAQAIHSVAESPVYAFAFDDVLKQDGTFSIPNTIPDQTPGTPEQPAVITFGSVGDLHVPSPGPNYQEYPDANDIAPITNVKETGFNCVSGSCTLSASWTNPPVQDANVKYFILPAASQIPSNLVLPSEALVDNTQNSQTVTFIDDSAPSKIAYVTVYACIPSDEIKASGYDCPSVGNGYTFGDLVPSVSSPTQGINLIPVTGTISNPGFTCSSSSCTLTASWTNPANPPGTQYYILPSMGALNQFVPISDVLPGSGGGQSFTSSNTSTLTLPFVKNAQQVLVSPVPNPASVSIQIMACINDPAYGKSCPSAPNYIQATSVASNPQAVN